MNFLRKLFSKLLKPCRGCAEEWPVIKWGWGEAGHYHPRTGQLVECGSLRPITMQEDS